MIRNVKLSRVSTVLGELSYPISRTEAAGKTGSITVLLADGTVNLGDVIAETPVEEFVDLEDALGAVMSTLPRRAVGEPYQSEGDA